MRINCFCENSSQRGHQCNNETPKSGFVIPKANFMFESCVYHYIYLYMFILRKKCTYLILGFNIYFLNKRGIDTNNQKYERLENTQEILYISSNECMYSQFNFVQICTYDIIFIKFIRIYVIKNIFAPRYYKIVHVNEYQSLAISFAFLDVINNSCN